MSIMVKRICSLIFIRKCIKIRELLRKNFFCWFFGKFRVRIIPHAPVNMSINECSQLVENYKHMHNHHDKRWCSFWIRPCHDSPELGFDMAATTLSMLLISAGIGWPGWHCPLMLSPPIWRGEGFVSSYLIDVFDDNIKFIIT